MVAGLIIAGVTTAVSAYTSNKARKQQKAASAQQAAIARSQAVKEQRGMLRQARIERARIAAAAMARGVSGSSGMVGAQSDIASQLTQNTTQSLIVQDRASSASSNLQQAARFNMFSNIFQSAGSLALMSGGDKGDK